jgi:photosystem II stability/assembly factor-like uncharacterized protein
MKNTKRQLALVLLASVMAACAPTPPQTPISTQIQVTTTPTPTPSFDLLPLHPLNTPQDDPFVRFNMFDEKNGWGLLTIIGLPCHVLHTTDGGQTWKDKTPSDHLPSEDCGTFFLDAQNAWVVSTVDPITSSARIIHHTSDGGQNWEQFKDLAFKSPTHLNFYDASHGWAVEAEPPFSRVYETADAGKTWKLLTFNNPLGNTTPDENLPPGTFRFDDGQRFNFIDTNTIWFGGNLRYSADLSIRFFTSHDAGKSWEKIEIKGPENQALNLGQQLIYSTPVFITSQDAYFTVLYDASPNNLAAIILTHDGGKTWNVSPTLLEGFGLKTYLQFFGPTEALVDCGNALCVSHDGAKTWQTVQSNVNFISDGTPKNKLVSGFYFINTTTGWATSIKNGKREILKTNDGGKTWTALPLVTSE